MKKTALLLSVIFFALFLRAQSPVQIVSSAYGLVNSQTLTFYIAQDQEIQEDFDVYFSGTPVPMMKIRKANDSLVGGTRSWFCTDQSCYGDLVTLSYSFNGFPGTYLQTHFKQSLTVCDTNVVRYTAYSLSNLADSAWFEIVYYCVGGLAGVNDAPQTNTLNAFPNPANNSVQLTFNPLQQNSQLEIYNQLGQRIETLQIAALSTSSSIDVNAFADGVYMIRLVNSEGLLSQKTIVVSH
ncbi:MAG: T9SS type A sorting domain-containing protein [Bacteroidia bacterium]